MRKFNLAIATNDPRSVSLVEELGKLANVVCVVQYDPISFPLKYLAAALAFSWSRREWWNKYHWHPIMRFGRRMRVQREIRRFKDNCDLLITWGSWFNPIKAQAGGGLPFYVYHDQSCGPTIEDGEIGVNTRARVRFNRYQNSALHHAHGIFCMSHWAAEQTLRAHKLPKSKVHAVGWGSCSINMLEEAVYLSSKDPMVLFVGHDFYRKGVDILRKAIPTVVDKVPAAKFVVIGGNSDRLVVEPHQALFMPGSVSDEEVMKDYFRKASVLVLPHRFDRSPHVLIEAMSAGKPVITSNQGGAVDPVVNGKTGFVIPVGDVEALAIRLIEILTNFDLLNELGTAAKKIVSENFTWRKVAERMMSVIETDLDYIIAD